MKRLIALMMVCALALLPLCVAEERGDLIIDRDGDGVEDIGYIAATAQDFIGVWQDEVSYRAEMDVVEADGTLQFTVSWSNSAYELTTWQFTGMPAEDGVVSYTDGVETVTVYEESGSDEPEIVNEGMVGCVAIDEDGAIYWVDADTEVSSILRFVRVPD